jgi:hypothetical protein
VIFLVRPGLGQGRGAGRNAAHSSARRARTLQTPAGQRLAGEHCCQSAGDSDRALQHLIFQGTFDKFPKLKALGAHGGGYLPSWTGSPHNAGHDMDFPVALNLL